VASFGILALQARGFRRLEALVAGLVGVIVGAFALQVVMADPDPSQIARGFVPGFEGSESVLLPSASSARRSCRTSSTFTRRSRSIGSSV
jgi:Mn2+/Fe2+ NRAMP family transporter